MFPSLARSRAPFRNGRTLLAVMLATFAVPCIAANHPVHGGRSAPEKSAVDEANPLVGTAPLDRQVLIGNAPPPCENATRKFGKRSKTPPNIIEQIASEVSAGIPTSHGSQYFGIRSVPIMSHGCTKIAALSCSAVFQTTSRDGWSKLRHWGP